MSIGVDPEKPPASGATAAEDCRNGDAEACWAVALDHRFADANDPEAADSPLRGLEGAASDAAVRKLLAPHCERGHAPSCAEIAATYFVGLDDPDRAARELLRKLYLERACDEGDSTSCLQLADELIAHEEGDLANVYFLRACQIGDTNRAEAACRALD
jgi:hypothetical protein